MHSLCNIYELIVLAFTANRDYAPVFIFIYLATNKTVGISWPWQKVENAIKHC